MARVKLDHATRNRIARVLDAGLPTLGVVVVLAAVLAGGGGWGPIWLAVIGLLMVEAGVWRLGSRIVHERRYRPLRREVHRFIGLARELHHASAAVDGGGDEAAHQRLEATVASLRGSLDRMIAVAAKTEEDLKAEQARPTAAAPAVTVDL
ncbi:MAG: hypothetical protein KY466_15540 [Gemmatimonadetes bacterium]|nr:hypothetical protein [Gemmatimonadota bacterium]